MPAYRGRMDSPDLLDDGRGPERVPRSASGRAVGVQRLIGRIRLGDRAGLVLGGLAVAALVAGTAVVGGHHPATPQASPARPPVVVAARPAQNVQLLLDQYSYTARKDGFSLQLSIVNYGTVAVDVLATRLPQAGARPIPGPGGDLPFAAPITLVPNLSAAITVPVRVTCPEVLTAPLADHVDVTLGHGDQATEVVHLPLTPLGSLLDDARHAACGVASASAAVYPAYVPGSVRVVGSDITTTLRLYDVGDARATVTILGAAPVSVQVTPVSQPVLVAAGKSTNVTVHWQVLNCAATEEVRWPSLRLTIAVPTSTATNSYGFDSIFGAQWQVALAAACKGRTVQH
jgi:hypothetical protein